MHKYILMACKAHFSAQEHSQKTWHQRRCNFVGMILQSDIGTLPM